MVFIMYSNLAQANNCVYDCYECVCTILSTLMHKHMHTMHSHAHLLFHLHMHIWIYIYACSYRQSYVYIELSNSLSLCSLSSRPSTHKSALIDDIIIVIMGYLQNSLLLYSCIINPELYSVTTKAHNCKLKYYIQLPV